MGLMVDFAFFSTFAVGSRATSGTVRDGIDAFHLISQQRTAVLFFFVLFFSRLHFTVGTSVSHQVLAEPAVCPLVYADIFTEHGPGEGGVAAEASGAAGGGRIDHVALKGRCGAKIWEVISGASVDATTGEDVSPPFLLIFNFQVIFFFCYFQQLSELSDISFQLFPSSYVL